MCGVGPGGNAIIEYHGVHARGYGLRYPLNPQ